MKKQHEILSFLKQNQICVVNKHKNIRFYFVFYPSYTTFAPKTR